MIRAVRDWALGGAAALGTVRAQGHDRLAALMEPSPAARRAPLGTARMKRRLRAADLSLRVLARLPRSPYRYTCLYRSLSRCALLRGGGVAARVRIGVRPDSPDTGGIGAHAWVEGDPFPTPDADPQRISRLVPMAGPPAVP